MATSPGYSITIRAEAPSSFGATADLAAAVMAAGGSLTALDVLDSFATRTLRSIAYTAKLRGANAVVVGIQPDVAFAMVQLGLSLEGVATALDLEEGLAYIRDVAKRGGQRVR